jgi:hypothetical protein
MYNKTHAYMYKINIQIGLIKSDGLVIDPEYELAGATTMFPHFIF